MKFLKGFYSLLQRIIFLTLILFVPIKAHALSCPKGGGILYKGDSVDKVIEQCGQPSSQQVYTKSQALSEVWEYFVPLNTGYQSMAKLSIQFNNNQVANIRILDGDIFSPLVCQTTSTGLVNTAFTVTNCYHDTTVNATSLCGAPVQLGDSTDSVFAICGEPNMKQQLQNYIIKINELTYNGNAPKTLKFENNKLVEFPQ